MIVAIDGPAGSGKSSTARLLAEKLGFLYLDTGSMYRAVALQFQRLGTVVTDDRIHQILESLSIEIVSDSSGMHVLLNGEDVTHNIRSKQVTDFSSKVSAIPEVRDKLVAEQRRMAMSAEENGSGVVMEGRDIGTVVFPDADIKFFLVAAPEERAKRRVLQKEESGETADYAQILTDIKNRDERDSTRQTSPLRQAEDAIMVDTTTLSFEEQVGIMESAIRERCG